MLRVLQRDRLLLTSTVIDIALRRPEVIVFSDQKPEIGATSDPPGQLAPAGQGIQRLSARLGSWENRRLNHWFLPVDFKWCHSSFFRNKREHTWTHDPLRDSSFAALMSLATLAQLYGCHGILAEDRTQINRFFQTWFGFPVKTHATFHSRSVSHN